MKELTIKEKAQRYDEAIERACKIKNGEPIDIPDGTPIPVAIFPELAESEDEKIWIINYLNNRILNSTIIAEKENLKKAIAWLEKQGKQKQDPCKNCKNVRLNCHNFPCIKKRAFEQGKSVLEVINEETVDNTNKVEPKFRIGDVIEVKPMKCHGKIFTGKPNKIIDITEESYILDDGKAYSIELQEGWKLSEQKPADKVEPKSHIGDWVVSPNGVYWHIDRIKNNRYEVTSDTGKCADWPLDTDLYHLWTIQDAKDGDVLIDKSHARECPFIFKETKPSDIKTDVLNPLTVLGYCGIGGAGFTKGCGWGDTANCTYYPATKEQRDFLFKKMKEAGYEWDAEKKELKKIEQEPAWSEEDENQLAAAINIVANSGHTCTSDWLKSLKERVQSQNLIVTDEELAKAKRDAYNDILDKIEYNSENPTFDDGWSAAIDYIIKKSLKDRVQLQNIAYYNPYKEVVESIAEMCKHYDTVSHSGLRDFYDNVKVKCKEAKEFDTMFPQKQWKPSEEQVECLSDAIKHYNSLGYPASKLKELLEDLKKLKEE